MKIKILLYILVVLNVACLEASHLNILDQEIVYGGLRIMPTDKLEDVEKALGKPTRSDPDFYYWDELGFRINRKLTYLEVYFAAADYIGEKVSPSMQYFTGILLVNNKEISYDNFPGAIEESISAPLNPKYTRNKRGQYWYVTCPDGFRVFFTALRKEGGISKLSISKHDLKPCECNGYQVDTRWRTDGCTSESMKHIKKKLKSINEALSSE